MARSNYPHESAPDSDSTDTSAPETRSHGTILIVMGVSGCGKSTVGNALASRLCTRFKDGDELHPAVNIQRMEKGIPLEDEDRLPWLRAIVDYARQHTRDSGCCVIACSALKRRYRDLLRTAGHVSFVFLDGSREVLAERMRKRSGHFMPADLLDSQLADLEDPRAEPGVITVDIDAAIERIVERIIQRLPHIGVDPAGCSRG